ncbi:MAG: hypothetical protein HYT42_02345 [Candidatus Sungbacteria bacterium]|nr:hypothetical protein [Candidatus Sungbacteria bacterium]
MSKTPLVIQPQKTAGGITHEDVESVREVVVAEALFGLGSTAVNQLHVCALSRLAGRPDDFYTDVYGLGPELMSDEAAKKLDGRNGFSVQFLPYTETRYRKVTWSGAWWHGKRVNVILLLKPGMPPTWRTRRGGKPESLLAKQERSGQVKVFIASIRDRRDRNNEDVEIPAELPGDDVKSA